MISLIVACSENEIIGKDGKLPWHIPEDLKRFKRVTQGKTVIMGSKTFDSIGGPLPNRENIVISKTRGPGGWGSLNGSKPATFYSFEPSLEGAIKSCHNKDAFIIGGGQIYEQAIMGDLVDLVYLTVVHQFHEGDTHFPMNLVMNNYQKIDEMKTEQASYFVYAKKVWLYE